MKGGEVFVVEEAKKMNHEMKIVVLWIHRIHWNELVGDEIGWVEEMKSGDACGVLEEEGAECMEEEGVYPQIPHGSSDLFKKGL